MRKMNKFCALVMALLLALSMISLTAMGEGEKLDAGTTNATGYPIVAEPITLKMLVKENSMRPNMKDTSVWDYVFEKTNIHVEVSYLKDADQLGLMFASRDYPDIMTGVGASNLQRADAAEAGDLVMIDELVTTYAPTWRKFFDEHPLAYKASLGQDGKLYSLPFCDFADSDRLLRDQWFLNTQWMQELGLKTPTTLEEFTAVLQAFSDNAGKGSIPAEVIPYYMLFDGYVGGQLDIYGCFGIPVTSPGYLAVEDGTVVYQAVNPEIKDALKYMRDLYAAGLIAPESFTDDWSMYVTKISSNPGIVGSYTSFANRLPAMYDPIAPMQAKEGVKPIIRRQTYTPGPPHAFMMFSNNQYPIATIRLCEFFVENQENVETIMRGRQGIFWDYNEDGKVVDLLWESNVAGMKENAKDMGLWNSFIGIRAEDFYANYYNKDLEDPKSRAWAYENIYKNYQPQGDVNYVEGSLNADDSAMCSQLAADIDNLRKTTFANWITGKSDIDAEWDGFVQQNEGLGLAEYLTLRQKAYDILMK